MSAHATIPRFISTPTEGIIICPSELRKEFAITLFPINTPLWNTSAWKDWLRDGTSWEVWLPPRSVVVCRLPRLIIVPDFFNQNICVEWSDQAGLKTFVAFSMGTGSTTDDSTNENDGNGDNLNSSSVPESEPVPDSDIAPLDIGEGVLTIGPNAESGQIGRQCDNEEEGDEGGGVVRGKSVALIRDETPSIQKSCNVPNYR